MGSVRRDESDLIVIPQGLSLADPGLSGIPSLRSPISSHDAIAALQHARAENFRQTLLPSCLVLGITLPLLAAGWFALDRFSVARDNQLGLAVPITLGVAGAFFLISALLLWLKSRGSAAAVAAN